MAKKKTLTQIRNEVSRVHSRPSTGPSKAELREMAESLFKTGQLPASKPKKTK